MMGVYIKGMTMPEYCYYCPVCDGERAKCNLTQKNIFDFSDGSRPADCPLVPVPTPHGRLKDVDELLRYKEREVCSAEKIVPEIRYVVDTKYIDEAPTIIEAEEGER